MIIKQLNYRKQLFMAAVLIALGINLNVLLTNSTGGAGTVLIAIGGLFFISGMNVKRKVDEKAGLRNKKKDELPPPDDPFV